MDPRIAPTTPAAAEAEELASHLARAHAVARRMLGCDHLAADAVQEARITLARLAAPPPALRAWLVRTVEHRCRHLRRTLARRRRHEQAAARCDLHADCSNPLHSACAHALGARLTAAIAALPPSQRRVFELFECHGLDYDAIARQLKLPGGTVRSRLHRARLALQRAVPAADAPD
jgi:RNA polymerase sigma-70 factor (ECF subfamily)